MNVIEWLLCPVYQSKTRTMVQEDSVLQNFPLYCPKCKRTVLVDVRNLQMTVIKDQELRYQADNL